MFSLTRRATGAIAAATAALTLAACSGGSSPAPNTPAAEGPDVFVKTPTTLAGPDDAVLLPTGATDADYEGELAIVIGRRALEDALAHVGGYTILNDVSDRAWQRRQSQWALGKCSDGSHRSARGSPRPTPPPTRGRARRGRPRRCRHGVAVDVAGDALAGSGAAFGDAAQIWDALR